MKKEKRPKSSRFTITQFKKKYKDDDACLEAVFLARYGNLEKCPSCDKKTKFHRVRGSNQKYPKKHFDCQECGYHISPLAGTIFHKSSTSLWDWFFAIYLFSTSKHGVSAKELQDKLGVTYKCAWRIAKQIRLLFQQGGFQLGGVVEVDESIIGGKKKGGKRGRGTDKPIALGMKQRGGKLKAQVIPNVKGKTLLKAIEESIKKDSMLYTDKLSPVNTPLKLSPKVFYIVYMNLATDILFDGVFYRFSFISIVSYDVVGT